MHAFIGVAGLQRRRFRFKDKVADAVEDRSAAVNLDAAEFVRPVADHGACSGINAGTGKRFQELSRCRRILAGHFVTVNTDDDEIGLQTCFLNFGEGAFDVVRVRDRFNVFLVVTDEIEFAEGHGAFRKGSGVPAGNFVFDRPVDEGRFCQRFCHREVLRRDVADGFMAQRI